jgi:glycosyltransferase involved in cell wall biosynthesis
VRTWRAVQLFRKGSRVGSVAHQVGKLARFGEPTRTLDYFRGREDFHHPGTADLLTLPPQRPTILHCHNLHGNYFDLRLLPALSRELPVILNLRDAWLLSGHCAHSYGCERWKTGCGSCPDLTIQPPIRRDESAYNWSRKAAIFASSRLYVTTPSQWLMDRVSLSMLSGARSKVIANAIDTEIFQPGNKQRARHELGLPSGGKVVMLTAHNQFKDLETMKAVLSELSPDTKTPLTFVCVGPNAPDHTLGAVEDPKVMAQYYRAADTYLHVAKAETFGKTIAEAMACGTPPVSTAVGGIPELIRNLETGILTPQSDLRALTDGLSLVLGDETLRDRMAAACALDARKRFNMDVQVNSFLAWYEEVLNDWTQWRSSQS